MERAWEEFVLKVEHNALRKECGLRPVYLTAEQTRAAHNKLRGEVAAAIIHAIGLD